MASPTIPTAPWRGSRSRRACRKPLLDVEFVQENGPEIVEDKKTIFAQLDKLAPPDALLVSSTSAITASRFTETLPGRARCLVGHPVNPPHLVPLVELCGAPWTSPDAIDRARKIYREIGQVPVTINREIDGFVLNRLQGALLAEAFRLVGEGYVSAEDLDHTVKDGLGPALVVSGTVRDHRAQCARRHSRLLRALHRLLQGAGLGCRRSRSLPKPECGPGDRGLAASADAGTHRRTDAAAQRAPGGAGRAQGQSRTTNPELIDRPARK